MTYQAIFKLLKTIHETRPQYVPFRPAQPDFLATLGNLPSTLKVPLVKAFVGT